MPKRPVGWKPEPTKLGRVRREKPLPTYEEAWEKYEAETGLGRKGFVAVDPKYAEQHPEGVVKVGEYYYRPAVGVGKARAGETREETYSRLLRKMAGITERPPTVPSMPSPRPPTREVVVPPGGARWTGEPTTEKGRAWVDYMRAKGTEVTPTQIREYEAQFGATTFPEGSTMHRMGFRTRGEYMTAQSYGMTYGPHPGELVPRESVVLTTPEGVPQLRWWGRGEPTGIAETKMRRGEFAMPEAGMPAMGMAKYLKEQGITGVAEAQRYYEPEVSYGDWEFQRRQEWERKYQQFYKQAPEGFWQVSPETQVNLLLQQIEAGTIDDVVAEALLRAAQERGTWTEEAWMATAGVAGKRPAIEPRRRPTEWLGERAEAPAVTPVEGIEAVGNERYVFETTVKDLGLSINAQNWVLDRYSEVLRQWYWEDRTESFETWLPTFIAGGGLERLLETRPPAYT